MDLSWPANHTSGTGIESGLVNRRTLLAGSSTLAAATAMGSSAPIQTAQAQQQPATARGQRPNILVIFGDDIGLTNVSAYSFGLIGYRTPNIDRVPAKA